MAFPPSEKLLYVPAEFINLGNLFGGQVKAVGGDPIYFAGHSIADKPQRLFRLINIGLAELDLGVVKYKAVGWNRVTFQTGFCGVGLDAADKMSIFRLPPVKGFMTLIAPIHDPGLSWFKDLADKRPLTAIARGEENFPGYGTVYIEAKMGFCLVYAIAVIGSVHGKNGIDEGAVNGDQIAEFWEFFRQKSAGLFL